MSTKKHLHTQKFRIILVLVISSAICTQAYSEQQDTNEPGDFFDMSLEDLMEIKVVTVSKREEKVSDAPATVIVITKEDISNRGYSNLKDVLRDLPGMEVIDNYFSENGTLVPVRGVLGNNKIVILINGMRVNPPGGEEFPIRSDFSVRYAERIEVIYGPGSTLYGQDAINAVINVITKKPETKLNGEVLAAGGTEDHKEGYFSLSKEYKTSTGRLGVSGFVQYNDMDLQDFGETYSDWWSNGKSAAEQVGTGDPPKRWDEGFNALLRIESENASLQAWHRESSRSSSEGGFVPILYFVDQAVWDDRSTVIEGRYNLELSDICDLESILTFNQYEIDPDTRYVWASSPTQLYYNDYKYGIGTSYSLEEQLSYSFSEKLSAIAGFVATYYDIIPKATIPGGIDTDDDIVSQGGTLTYYTVQGDTSSNVTIPRAHNLNYNNYGFYAESRFDATEKVRIIAGIRSDNNSRYSKKPLSPRLAFIYQPRNDLTLKYIYTEAFVSPAPYYGYNVFDNGTLLNIANSDLMPEEATSHEINLSYNRKNILVGTSVYLNNQDNLIVTETSAPAIGTVWMDEAGTDSRTLIKSANSSTSESKGVDVYLKYKMDKLSLWSSYSYLDFLSELSGQTSGLPGISRHNIRAGVTYKVLDKLTTTLSGVYRSTPDNVTNLAGLDNEIRDPYYLNLHVNYDLNDITRAYMTIYNLTDNQYALRGMVTPTPQEGIKLIAGLCMRF